MLRIGIQVSTRAFLFGWNPKVHPEERWTHLDDLVSSRSGEDWWDTPSSKPQVGDWAFGVKLGTAPPGFFARGVIKEIDRPPGTREVTVEWRQFLDPREASELLDIPRPVGKEKQLWLAQSNGTEIKRFPVARLHELWEKHFRDRSSPQRLSKSEVESDVQEVLSNSRLSTTEKQQLVQARRGQGRFRTLVGKIEDGCRLTGVTDRTHLRASHAKPWRASNNTERLDGNNGLLLAPHIDHLFDRGFISFEADGRLLVSPRLKNDIVVAWSISRKRKPKAFTIEQRDYIAYHRKNVYLSK